MSRPEPVALLSLAESIADGAPIDWDAAEAGASDRDRVLIGQLRVLSNLAGLHRSLPAVDGEPRGKAEERDARRAPAIGNWAHLALIEWLGGGTSGDVYRAWDRHLERDVALKLLRADESTDDLHASRIAREGRLLARLRHANVITVHGVDAHDGRVGLWMELVRGVTLEQQIAARGPLSAREAALAGIDLCRALAAIHAAGLIHRDVKAQNVMREDGGRIVLMDLGTGREMDAAGEGSSDLAGTPLYQAPEIFSGTPASERTDLYSLGVLLYHLVTGSFPVRATTIEELRARHRAGDRVRLRDARADLPTAFVRVIDRATAADPQQRYATAGAFEADLVAALGDAPSTDGPIRDREEPREPTRRTTLTRAGVLIAALAATIAIAAAGWPRWWFTPAPVVPHTIRSIAVLPLANLSGDPAQEYFADGMTDELIGTVGRLGGINVISRTSAMQFKASKKTAPQIAKALKVDAVLEGSVRLLEAATPNGPRTVRINARLIYAGTDTQLWDRTFETVISDVVALQGEIAQKVADAIQGRLNSPSSYSPTRLTAVQGRRAVNPQAYEAYLRGRYLWNKRNPVDLRRALEEFKKSVDLDPTSALAWSGLADGYSMLANYDDQPPRSVKPQAKAAALRALTLDDTLGEAHATLAEFAWNYDWDLATAKREFDRALELNPNYASAHQWRGLYLAWAGRFDEGLAEMQRAQALDPLAPIIEVNVARCYFYARRYDEAIAALRQLAQREPDFWPTHALLGQVYLAQARYPDAIDELLRARELSPSSVRNIGVLGDIYARAGRRRDAEKMLGELTAIARTRYVPPVYPAMVYMGLGDKRMALDLLEKSFADRSDWILQMNVEPAFDLLRGEPRFQDIVRRAQPIAP